MSWNLLIYKGTTNGEKTYPMGEIGKIKEILQVEFPDLVWPLEYICSLEVDGGFEIEFKEENKVVQNMWTNGGYNHLPQLCRLAKENDWRICDAQEGGDLDLDDPYKNYE